MRILDPGSCQPWIRDLGWKKSNLETATLATFLNFFVRTSVKGGVSLSKLIPWDPYRTYLRCS
jgi:hypothetical protein